jgi:hypothetical protein
MVHLQDLHQRYGDEGLFVFAISMAPDPDEARDWNRERGLTYTVFDGHGSELGERLAYG